MPDWLTMQDETSLRAMHWGGEEFTRIHFGLNPPSLDVGWTPQYVLPWLRPAGWWTAFAITMWMVCLAFANIFQRRWIHSERLTYPIVMLPLEMVAERSRVLPQGFYRSGAMWLAFGLAFGLDLLNGKHTLTPSWPSLSVSPRANPNLNLVAQLLDRPWNAIGYAPVSFYPFVIGLGLLLPTELAQSCVIFFWFWKAQLVFGAWIGQNTTAGFPWVEEQEFGGYVGVTAFFLWASRGHLKEVWRQILRPPKRADRFEGMSHRTSATIVVLGTIFLVGFAVRAGMPIWMAIPFFLIYYVLSLAIGRIRAEMGMPAHDLHFAGPDQMLVGVFGSRAFPAKALGFNSMTWWFNRAFRSQVLPHQAEAFKAAERTGADAKGMVWAIVVAVVIAMPVAFWAMLQIDYNYGVDMKMSGGARGFGAEPMNKLASWLTTPTDFDYHRLASIIIGFLFITVFMFIKTRVGWWPIHPVGYAVSASWSMQFLWCPLMIASTIKWAMTRYGGYKSAQTMVPFAFGLILGDLTGGSFWTLYSMWKHVTVYSIWQ
jgi:hypothetical protein